MGDEAHPGHPLGDEQPAVDARQADRVDAQVAQPGDELAVDDAAQDGRGDLERGGIGHPQAALEPDGTPSRSSHSVIRLPPPWTSTTGRWRATAATSLEHLAPGRRSSSRRA